MYNTQKTVCYWCGEKAIIDLGKMEINKIKYSDLQEFFDKRQNESKSVNKDIKSALNRIFKYAIRSDYIDHNPMAYVVVSGVINKRDKHILTSSEYEALLHDLTTRNTLTSLQLKMIVEIGHGTGMRISEILALHKKDIDLHNRRININHKLNYKGLSKSERFVSTDLKSIASADPVIIPDSLILPLKEWMDECSTDALFLTKEGYYQNPDSLGNRLRKICKDDLDFEFHFHLLRDCYATTLVNAGVEPKVAQELLRHKNFNTTFSIYAHALDDKKRNCVNQLF